jgi:hypothetical protein
LTAATALPLFVREQDCRSSSGAAIVGLAKWVAGVQADSVQKRLLAGAVGVTMAAVAVSAAFGQIAGLGVALVGTAALLVAKRLVGDAQAVQRRGEVSERQRQTLPTWYAEHDVFPVPNWAWAVLALLVLTPYLLGEVHVLSQDHADSWLLLGFVGGALVLYASGRGKRRKAHRHPG